MRRYVFRALYICSVAVVGLALPTAKAGELLPPDRAMADVIDHYVDLKLKQAKVTPAPQADEAALVRRMYLDLAGRIPVPDEVRDYLNSTEPQKRALLIQELLAAPDFIRYNAAEFDRFLRNDNDEGGSVHGYLLQALAENRPWDQMFRELLGAAEKPDPARPELYVLKRLKDRNTLAQDVSSVFFGLNVTCAQCHRHPYIESLTQDYFFGMREFFASSYDFQGKLLDRRFVKPAEFKAKDGQVRPVKMMFLSGQTVDFKTESVADLAKAVEEETKTIDQLSKNYAKAKELPTSGSFRARAELVGLALDAQNRDRFAAAMINRLWNRFLGYGLVMRTDQMHDNNPASHPELLQWLTRDFIAHRYDLKRLIGGLLASKTYSRSSDWNGGEPPSPSLFAVAAIRPLTPLQWSSSFSLANDPSLIPSDKNRELREKSLTALENQSKGLASLIEYPRDDMSIPITEAMRLSNDPGILKSVGGKLAPALLKSTDRKQQLSDSVWAVLSRPPTEEEITLYDSYLERRRDRPEVGLQQLLWALINSAEFRFNH